MHRRYRIASALFLFLLLLPISTFSQQDGLRVGNDNFLSQQGGFYNFGNKDGVNIYVNLWGYVKFPGKYLIPKGSTIVDLISYGGGPLTDATLEDIRLFRPKNDSIGLFKDELKKFDYNDLVWEEDAGIKKQKANLTLLPGDVLVLTGEPRYFARDNLNLILAITSVMISLGILAVSIAK
ncbi:MAG: SLBB domain-containing protein [Ignavibacteria bacterium]|nr:SLBB domain-containing protein [Ignavibacteria bacterium]